jgi:hypothetical protein
LEISANFPSGGSITPGNFNTPNNGVGFSEIDNASFTVYPNPCSDRISISGLQSDVALRIYSMTGAEVFSGKTINGQVQIPASISSGLYLLQAEVDNHIIRQNLSVIR